MFFDKLHDALENGTSLDMDFRCSGRDGCFEKDQLFAVWEKKDVEMLISRLQECIHPLTTEDVTNEGA